MLLHNVEFDNFSAPQILRQINFDVLETLVGTVGGAQWAETLIRPSKKSENCPTVM